MTVEQRDVYLFPPTHDSKLEHHPFIVLSTKEANEYEKTFVAVMVTSSDIYRDDFSFELTDGMFDGPLPKKDSHVRMHLLTLCIEKHIKGPRINRMKPAYFKQLMKSIGDLIFNYDFNPLN
jgi:mRNA-degrading endonuclease toxin of MazEF toxin-antitoxin module